jgi:hypothetical protein
MNQQLRVLQDFGVQIEQLAAQPTRRALRRRRLLPIAVAVALLAFAAAALAATGVFKTGGPVRAGVEDLTQPQRGYGGVRPGGVTGILARAPDPAGGPPWGLRIIGTTRGLDCLQVGRVVDGRIGVLGADGAFHDDGRFHPLPAAVNSPSPFCYPPDANGNLFVATGFAPIPASGYELRFAFDGRVAALAAPGGCSDGSFKPAPEPACPAGDERALYFGMLGPNAARIVYSVGGQPTAVATGAGGAYVIALPASKSLADADSTSLTPQPGAEPIREVTYRDGSTCDIPVAANGRPCPAVGYRAPRAPEPDEAAGPLRVTHSIGRPSRRGGPGVDELRVAFTARVAVDSAQDAYVLVLERPVAGECIAGGVIATGTDADIAAGDRVSLRLAGRRLGPCPGGTYTGTVYYQQSTPFGAPTAMLPPSALRRHDPFGVDLPVGHFSFTEGVRATRGAAREP